MKNCNKNPSYELKFSNFNNLNITINDCNDLNINAQYRFLNEKGDIEFSGEISPNYKYLNTNTLILRSKNPNITIKYLFDENIISKNSILKIIDSIIKSIEI